MECQNLTIANYHENFADNFTSIAYANILQEKFGSKCYFKNSRQERKNFEEKMAYFDIEYNYISQATIDKISLSADIYNKDFVDNKKLIKNIKRRTKSNKNNILNLKFFQIDDIDKISPKTKKMFEFNKKDFLVNYDVLDKITSTNSVGLYINKNDIIANNIDYDFIYRATMRLNKYLIKPKLFIFSSESIKDKITSCFDFEIIKQYNWREEFYFLSKCRHKIVLNSPNSYSEGFWASILKNRDYSITIFDKNLSKHKKYHNWLGV